MQFTDQHKTTGNVKRILNVIEEGEPSNYQYNSGKKVQKKCVSIRLASLCVPTLFFHCFCNIMRPHSVLSFLLLHYASPLLLRKMTSKLRQLTKRRQPQGANISWGENKNK